MRKKAALKHYVKNKQTNKNPIKHEATLASRGSAWCIQEVNSVALSQTSFCGPSRFHCRKGSALRGYPGIHCLSVRRAEAKNPAT